MLFVIAHLIVVQSKVTNSALVFLAYILQIFRMVVFFQKTLDQESEEVGEGIELSVESNIAIG